MSTANKPDDGLEGLTYFERQIAIHNVPEFPCGVALFEHVLVYRLPAAVEKRETFAPDGLIVKSESRLTTDKHRTPRCILVSAGVGALDFFRRQGVRLGDVVWIAPDVFTRYQTETDERGLPIEFAFCNVDDIITSEGLATRLFHHEEGEDVPMRVIWDRDAKKHMVVLTDLGQQQERDELAMVARRKE